METVIVTPYCMAPPSMRVVQLQRAAAEQGTVRIIHPDQGLGVRARLLQIRCQLHDVAGADRYIFYDLLTLLALLDFVVRHRTKIIYDVLDYFPGYYAYKAGLRGFWLRAGMWSLSHIERGLVRWLIPVTIVNSPFLARYLSVSPALEQVLYASPFEDAGLVNDAGIEQIAGLYLGLFSADKGAMEVIDFARRWPDIPIHVLGEWMIDAGLAQAMPKNIVHLPRLPPEAMKAHLATLMRSHFLVGFSMIHSENPSYAVQEANKEIDYLCCGIPIVGNDRPATQVKILDGCGFAWNDDDAMARLLSTPVLRLSLRDAALAHYQANYRRGLAHQALQRLFATP